MKISSSTGAIKLTVQPQRIMKAASNRASFTVQNHSDQTEPIYTSPCDFTNVRKALRIDPGSVILRDIFAPASDIWASTTAAGEVAGVYVTFSEDFAE